MHIALLSSQRAYYGGEVHLRDLGLGLRRRGHRVSMLVRPDSELKRRLVADGFDVHPLPLWHWCDPMGLSALHRCLRGLQPDILHSHTPRDYYLSAAATLGLPIHNVGTRHQLIPIGHARLKRPFLRRFAAMIAVSEAVRDGLVLSGIPLQRLITVPNGVAPAAAGEAPMELRRQLGLPASTGPVIGCVGMLSPAKGQDILLWAASLLRGRWPGLQVVLIGGETGRQHFAHRLRTMARELGLSVTFAGYQDQAASLLPALDMMVLPSRAEPFGLVTAEALARGIPVVATRSGGSREIVRDEREGLLVAPGDPEALAGAIGRLLADHKLWERCHHAGPRRVASHFSLERQVTQTERVYSLVLAGAEMPQEGTAAVQATPDRSDALN